MDEISSDLLLQLSTDELAEVLEELTGEDFSDEQVAVVRQLLQAAGSLEAAFEMLGEIGPASEAA